MNLTQQITTYFIKHDIISCDEREIYEYGVSLMLADAFNFAAILFIGAIASSIHISIIYLLCFTGLRLFCGGYHANTHLKCHCCTIGTFVGFLFLNGLFQPDYIDALFAGDIFFFVPIVCFAPVAHANKILTDIVKKNNRRRAIGLYGILTVISMLLCRQGRQEGVVISLTLWIVSIGMIPAIKYTKGENER